MRCFSPVAFRIAPLLALLLLLTGCGKPKAAVASANEPKSSGGSFEIGPPKDYQTPGVYRAFADRQSVYLVSGHDMLVALYAECTNDEHAPSIVRFDDVSGVYTCQTCGATYTRDGLNKGVSRTSRPLERCRIRQSGHIYDPEMSLVVDPGKRFLQEKQEWSKHTSYFPLIEVINPSSNQDLDAIERRRELEMPPLSKELRDR